MYSDIVQVSDTVQRSINLEFDLHNQKQLENFVPTSSTCHVLKAYFKTALGYAHDNSVLLVGAYGRGKTFLALLLSELLDYRNHARLQPVLNKIAALDEELYELLQEYAAKKMRLVPIVIRSGYDELNQSFLISLKKSLELEDLSQINPQTLFDMALTVLQSWHQETEELSSRLKAFLDQFQISLEGLEKGLKKQNSQALETFRSLYRFMTFGMEFNPLISQDPIKAYEQAMHDLESESIQGFFVILDEMSKLLDDSKEELQKKLKLIQDFAELANRSIPNHQVLFTCITHKSLGLYASQLDALTTSAFRTVEGRFKEIHIKHPPLEYLQLLSLSLNKKTNYLEVRDQFWQN
ncbi:MAG: hypothetical protein K2H85_10745, partial [Allobaculum sp.]|nr:hypothetical protein [Allobaculum sp.]